MSGMSNGLQGQAEEEASSPEIMQGAVVRNESRAEGHEEGNASLWQNLPRHDFIDDGQQGKRSDVDKDEERYWDRDPDLWLYRKKTTTLLRRYMRWSLEAGRVPSLLGRELFRSRISASSAVTFEERIIFLHDVEGCLERLQGFDRQIIARVVLQEHDHDAAARILQCDRKTIERRLPELIDELTDDFLRAELLERLPETKDDAL